MSATKASAAYAELDRLATNALLSKARKAARRVNWRHYAVSARGWRKKWFGTFAKARAYWNQIKAFGSFPTMESRRYGVKVSSPEYIKLKDRPAANDNKKASNWSPGKTWGKEVVYNHPPIATPPRPRFPWELFGAYKIKHPVAHACAAAIGAFLLVLTT